MTIEVSALNEVHTYNGQKRAQVTTFQRPQAIPTIVVTPATTNPQKIQESTPVANSSPPTIIVTCHDAEDVLNNFQHISIESFPSNDSMLQLPSAGCLKAKASVI